MKLIFKIIPWIFAQLFSSLICFVIYNYMLIDLFKFEISYFQWLSIIIIISHIAPVTKYNNIMTKDIKSKSKLNDFISSLILRNEQ